MTIENLPVWPFEPNWTSSVTETLEWLTDVLSSPSGAEQRRTMRYFPRKSVNFTIATEGDERSLLDNLLMTYAAQEWYLPLWHDVTVSTAASVPEIGGIGTTLPCVPSDALAVGRVVFIKGDSVYGYKVAEITSVSGASITVAPAISQVPAGTIIHPMTTARLIETPSTTAMSDGVETSEPQFLITEKPDDPGTTARVNGPMIVNGLIVNAYHRETGRGGYFHYNSGTSEGQFIFIYGLYLAYEQLIDGTAEQAATARYYKRLAEQMLDAMGDGTGYVGPMLRQPVPASADVITLMHWLFAAKGDIPGQEVVLSYEIERDSNTLTIPSNAGGGKVFKVWQIYPGTSALLYDSPFSPAYDIASPGAETQVSIEDADWTTNDGETVITIPIDSPTHPTWKVVYGYSTDEIIPQGYAFEAYPNWTSIPSGYSACAPDTFRWFEQAMRLAVEHDERDGKAAKWEALRLAMRRTAVRGQAITDIREVFQPMPDFPAIPVRGAPDGMYCYTSDPDAKGPPAGGDSTWRGYDFWSRDDDGVIVGNIPPAPSRSTYTATAAFPSSLGTISTLTLDGTDITIPKYNVLTALSVTRVHVLDDLVDAISAMEGFTASHDDEVLTITKGGAFSLSCTKPSIVLTADTDWPVYVSQIGRGFSDQWREAETYQEADQYLYVRLGASRAFADREHLRVYVSSTQAYDPATRWFAEIDTLGTFEPGTGTIEFFIPRSAFKLATNTSTGAATTWGSVLPAGSELKNFGVEVAYVSALTVRLHSMRLVSDDTEDAVAGADMPFFPGAQPFAINADVKRQQFVGWNGSPFHGYQLPDHWWWLGNDALAVHSGLTAGDLPIPAADGSLTYPISATTTGGVVVKPLRALLMEQQLMFLKQAQDKYDADGGNRGFFAHTFVLNTPVRASLGNPTPHTWVYVNDDPNTRWVGYQTRVVESLAELVWLTRNTSSFADARALALDLADEWLKGLNLIWPDLTGTVGGAEVIYGMPTDFPDPAISGPQTLYEEPHAAAQVLRACLTLKRTGLGATWRHNALITRCWDYLEMMWRTTGEMAFTWSPNPAARQWYGFWHGEIITTLAAMLNDQEYLPEGISAATVAQRLTQTRQWIENWGVGRLQANTAAGLVDEYRGFHVLTLEPDWTDRMDRGQQRILDTMENNIGIPEQTDVAGRPFPTQSHKWVLDGLSDHARFYALAQALRGRSVAVWVPTWMYDMQLASPIVESASTITVGRCGFTLAGGPRPEREDIVIETVAGERLYRRILDSAVDGSGRETLLLDEPIGVALGVADVLRICFMSLMRLDHDSVEIEHLTDIEGVSEVQLTFRAAPNLRMPEAAVY